MYVDMTSCVVELHTGKCYIVKTKEFSERKQAHTVCTNKKFTFRLRSTVILQCDRSSTQTKGSTRFTLPSGARESKHVDPEGVVTNLFRPYAT